MYNGTGSVLPKGTCVSIDTAGDFYMTATPVDNAYTCQGILENTTQANAWGQVVQGGMAQMLVEDNHSVAVGQWIMPSYSTAGRVTTQDQPGFDFYASTLTYDTNNGATVSGTLASLEASDASYLVVSGTSGAPSIDMRFTFTGVTGTPNELIVTGYFPPQRAAGLTVSIWDYVAGGGSWVVLPVKFEPQGATTTTVSTTSVTADMISTGEMRVRLHAADAGGTGERFYLNSMVFRSTADHEHFKEVGHILESKEAGTNVLVWAAVHLL